MSVPELLSQGVSLNSVSAEKLFSFMGFQMEQFMLQLSLTNVNLHFYQDIHAQELKQMDII